MNQFGMAVGEMPEDTMDRVYDAAEVFKNFSKDSRPRHVVSREHRGQGREFVVEVRRHKRLVKDAR